MIPPLRPWSRGAVPVVTGSEAADFDRRAMDGVGVPEAALMESAGRAAADLADHLAPRGRVVLVAGSGNNGGDAVVAARTLAARGRDVQVLTVGSRPDPDPLLHGWDLPRASTDDLDEDALAQAFAGAALVVDGVLGTGIRGAPRAPADRVVRALGGGRGDGRATVLSLDVPSGVDADTGAVAGEAVAAAVTLCFGWPKLGVLLEPGRRRAGRVVAAEIGFPPADDAGFQARLLTPAWLRGVVPRRDPDTHKNRVGAVLVVGGGAGMAGAAVLAARSALRVGAGFVRVAGAAANREILQATLPDAPFVALDDGEGLSRALEASRAAVVGPGLGTGPDAAEAVAQVLEAPVPVVLDADALNLLSAGRPRGVAGLAREAPRVLTPHPGEMARLLGGAVPDLETHRPETARRLARESGATVVYKGTPSLVATPGEALAVSGIASSDLAVAGMGDVLAGSIGGLLAQGLDPSAAAGAALLLGARAALRTGLGAGLAASDVPDALPGALAESDPGHTDLPFRWVTLDLDAPR